MWEKIDINKIDKNKLESELKIDIAKDLNLDKEIITNLTALIDIKTKTGLDLLKFELSDFKKEIKLSNTLSNQEKETIEKLTEEEKEKLFNVLKWYKKLVWNDSKNNLESLKDSIQKEISINEWDFEKILPKNILTKLENPKSVWDEILWIAFWTANSIYTTTKFLYELWTWLIKTPYHIYLIVSWKAKYKIPENI